MMDILESRNLTDVCVVVTRYFGGTLLGTGGLVRAYSGAARDAVEHSVISPRLDGVLVDYTFTYDLYGKLQHYTENHEVYINKSDFSDVVRVRLLMKKGLKESVDKDFSEMSGGKVVPGEVRDCRFIIAGGRPQLTD